MHYFFLLFLCSAVFIAPLNGSASSSQDMQDKSDKEKKAVAASSTASSSSSSTTAARVKGLDDEQSGDGVIELVIPGIDTQKEERESFPREYLQYSGLLKTMSEGDNDAKELSLNAEQMKIPLAALKIVLKAMHDDPPNEELRKLISDNNAIAVLSTANYIDIPRLVSLAVEIISDEFSTRYQKDQEWAAQLRALPAVLQQLITRNAVLVIPCVKKMWDNASKQSELEPRIFTQGEGQYDVSPNGKYVCIQKQNLPMEIWDLESSKKVTTFNNIPPTDSFRPIIWNPDGTMIGIQFQEKKENFLKVYNVFNGQQLYEINESGYSLHGINADRWASNDYIYLLNSKKNTVNVYSGRDGILKRVIPNVANLRAVNFSKIYLQKPIHGLDYVILDTETNHETNVQKYLRYLPFANSFSPNGKFLIWQESGKLRILNLIDMSLIETNIYFSFLDSNMVVWSSDSNMFATIKYGIIEIYDVVFRNKVNQSLRSPIKNRVNRTLWLKNNTLVIVTNSNVQFFDLRPMIALINKSKNSPLSIDQLMVLITICNKEQLSIQGAKIAATLPEFWQSLLQVSSSSSQALVQGKSDIAEKERAHAFATRHVPQQLASAQSQLPTSRPASAASSSASSSKQVASAQSANKSNNSNLKKQAVRPQTPASSRASSDRPLHAPKMDLSKAKAGFWSPTHELIATALKNVKNSTASNLKRWAAQIRTAKNTVTGFAAFAANADKKTIVELLQAANKRDGIEKKFPKEWKELMDLLK